MIRRTLGFTAVLILATVVSVRQIRPQSRSENPVVLYEGGRIIPGNGSPAIESAAMLVENGIVTRISAKGSVNVPRSALRVDLTGKTIMPALINTHGHPGFQRGLTYSADNFTRQTIMDD